MRCEDIVTIDDFYQQWCNSNQIHPDLLLRKTRKQTIVNIRILFMKSAKREGFTFREIAEKLNMDHSTIVYHVNNEVIG
jgi:DNA-binding NarL/FixJ family response regulator